MNFKVSLVFTKFYKAQLNPFFLLHAMLCIKELGWNGDDGDREDEEGILIENGLVFPVQLVSWQY